MLSKTIPIVLPLLATLVSTQVCASATAELMAISLTAEKQIVKSGDDFPILLTFQDTSDRTILVPGIYRGYEFFLTDRAGESLQERKSLQSMENRTGNVDSLPRQLKPNETFSKRIILNNLFDITTPGTYILHVEASPLGEPAASRSNAIQITVLP